MDKQITNKGQWFIDQLNVYQSANSDHQSIKNNFIIRLNEFNIIIESLKNKETKDSLQNELILGRRGSGKSTLLKRIEIEIVENKELNNKFIPVNLAEEQAGIYRLFDLWDEVLKEMSYHLGTQLQLKDFSEFKQDQEYTRYLYQNIHEICTVQNRKIVLLLDNFDRIVENFSDDGNLLRETLINFNDLVIIAGSTRMDEHFWSYDMPFYEFFRRHRLESLDREELYKLLNHWSKTLDIPELKVFITNNPGKIENIRLLTDGLPRTIQFFIQMVLQDANSLGYDYLKKIMDNATPLYQERLNHQTAQLRKIILEMAFIWEACNTKQLVEKCKMESKLISANLKTLIDRGIVDKIETSKKNHLYRISERFFNMWLIITQGNPEQKRKAKWLSIFLENWYDTNDLKRLTKKHIELLERNELDRKDALIISKGLSQCKYITVKERDRIIELTENLNKATDSNILLLPEPFINIFKKIIELINLEKYNEALKLTESIENEEDGFKFFLIGEINYIQNNYPTALKYLIKAKQKKNKFSLFFIGDIYEEMGKYSKAEEYYFKAIEEGIEEALIKLASLYKVQKKFAEAEKYYLVAIDKGNEDAMNNLATIYEDQKKNLEAEKYYLMAIENKNEIAMFNLALLYDNQKKYVDAEIYYLMAIETGSKEAMNNLALLYKTQEKFSEAEKYFIMSIEKGSYETMNNLAQLYETQEKYSEAEKYYLMAIETGSENAMNNLAILYTNQKKYAEAEKYYLMAIEKGDKEAMNNIAQLYETQEKYSEVEKYYLMAIEKGSENAMNNLAILYTNHKKYAEAEKYYLMAIEKGSKETMNNLAQLNETQEKYSEAEKYYLMAIETGNENAMNNLAILYTNQKKYAEAEKYYLMAIEKGIEDALFNLALLYDNLEEYIEAEKYYLMAIDKGSKDAMNNLAVLYVNQKKNTEAEKYYLKAIEKGSKDAMNNLAVIYDNQKKYAEAEKYYLMAIGKGNVQAISNLAISYYNSNNNKKKALELFQKALNNLNNIRHQKNFITAEIWNGVFNNVEERLMSLIQENTDDLYEFILDMLIHQQKTLILKMFNHEVFGKTLQEKYTVLYYVCLLLNNKTDDNLELRIPPEIKPTIEEVLALIDEKQTFYGYKKKQ
jgi:TPR repeat protein